MGKSEQQQVNHSVCVDSNIYMKKKFQHYTLEIIMLDELVLQDQGKTLEWLR